MEILVVVICADAIDVCKIHSNGRVCFVSDTVANEFIVGVMCGEWSLQVLGGCWMVVAFGCGG